MKNITVAIYVLIYLISTASKAHAYLDPGTGSIILQAILGFIAAAAATISVYWDKFKSFISGIFKKDTKENKDITKQ